MRPQLRVEDRRNLMQTKKGEGKVREIKKNCASKQVRDQLT